MNYANMQLLSRATLLLISAWQNTISPDHGRIVLPYVAGSCRFYPSCSVYAKEAIRARGFFKGCIMALWRVLRCSPLSRGGYDPIGKHDPRKETEKPGAY